MSSLSSDSGLLYLLHYLAASFERQSDQLLQEQFGIGFAQFKVLWSLQINPKAGQRELADSLAQSEASVSRQVKLLRNRGMVISQINPKNRRQHFTVITLKGTRVREAGADALDKLYQKLLVDLDAGAKRRLIGELQVLYRLTPTLIKHDRYRHIWENMI